MGIRGEEGENLEKGEGGRNVEEKVKSPRCEAGTRGTRREVPQDEYEIGEVSGKHAYAMA
jgi:hypothetical protein